MQGEIAKGKEITGEEVLRVVKTFESKLDDDNEGKHLAIIAHRNIDLEKVKDFWTGYLNASLVDEINEKLKEGYVPIRIQTEWADNFGHSTMIYMVKY